MSLTAIIFLILRWFEFFVLFFSGVALEKTNTRRDYWRIAIAPIVAFALVEGLRWGRLIDWNNAVVSYSELNSFIDMRNMSNPFYSIILYSLKCLGLSYPFFVVLQCGFLFFSALFLLQDYKKYLRWILPCLIVAFIHNENFIRFFFSLSFLFIAIYYYLHGSLRKYVLFSVMTVLSHFSQLPFVLIFPFLKFLNNKQIPKIFGIVLYLVSAFLGDITSMEFLVTISDFIVSLVPQDVEYTLFSRLGSMNDIIHGVAYGTEGHLFVKSISNKIANVILYVPLLWMAPKYLRNVQFGTFIYNMTVINLILTPILGQAELLHRLPMIFYIFVVISFAVVVVNSINHRSTSVLIYMMLFIYFYSFLNAPFVRDDYMMYFLWDSNGAATNYAPYLK